MSEIPIASKIEPPKAILSSCRGFLLNNPYNANQYRCNYPQKAL